MPFDSPKRIVCREWNGYNKNIKEKQEVHTMKQYVVDAFTDKVFAGNPAAVCVMDEWLSDEVMMKITVENNLSETAFSVKEGDKYHLRWFTPGGEIDLCGHATLGTAYVITTFVEPQLQEVVFTTMSGILRVKKVGDLFELDFPAYELEKIPVIDEMEEVLGVRPVEAFMARDMLCVLESEEQVRNLQPDMTKMLQLDGLLVHVTAKGSEADCVSRSFAPKLNVPEDPVCGSGHCHIVPYWLDTLGVEKVEAYQASRRGGTLYCRREGDRIVMAGKAALFSQAEIFF